MYKRGRSSGRSVGHEEDRVPVVLAAGMRLGQVSLGLLDQVVLVLAGDRLTAGAVQVRLHMFTIAYRPRWRSWTSPTSFAQRAPPANSPTTQCPTPCSSAS